MLPSSKNAVIAEIFWELGLPVQMILKVYCSILYTTLSEALFLT